MIQVQEKLQKDEDVTREQLRVHKSASSRNIENLGRNQDKFKEVLKILKNDRQSQAILEKMISDTPIRINEDRFKCHH